MKQLSLLITAFFIMPFLGRSDIVSFNFEGDGLLDGTPVLNTFAKWGIHFTNATVQVQGFSLSPLFPPANGTTSVAVDVPLSPMDITFGAKTVSFSALFTWTAPLQFFIEYRNGTVAHVSSTDADQYGPVEGMANFLGAEAIGGKSHPNDVFTFTKASGIEEIAISTTPGLQTGDTFTIDSVVANVFVPEPNEAGFIAGGLVVLLVALRKRISHRQ